MSTDFDYSLDYKNLDLRENPELYRVGRGEQGVLMVEPYKAEILPNWRFKTEEIARESSGKIFDQFIAYRDSDDFVGMDMARKFLQMGYTRARRYANHSSGRKYGEDGEVREQDEGAMENEKARAARVFYKKYVEAREDPHYKKRRKTWVEWSKAQPQ
ncbi:MAG: DUF4385 domain-containing protein [Rubrobacter sp.]